MLILKVYLSLSLEKIMASLSLLWHRDILVKMSGFSYRLSLGVAPRENQATHSSRF